MAKIGPAYLFCGPDAGEKRRSIEKLRDHLQRNSGTEVAIERCYPFETVIVDIVASLRTPSLFTPRRLVVLGQAEALKAADIAVIVDYCHEPATNTTLVIETEEFRVAKRLQDAIPTSCRRIFWERFPDERRRNINEFFRERDIKIDDEAAEILSEIVGSSSATLEDECAALATLQRTLPDDQATLGPEEIDRWVHHSRIESVFTLFDHVGSRELSASMRSLQAIMLARQTTSSQLIGGLASQFRKAAKLQTLSSHTDQRQTWQKLKVSGKRAQASITRAADRYMSTELQAILQLLAEFDLRIRAAAQQMQLSLLRMLLFYVVARGGQGAWKLFSR